MTKVMLVGAGGQLGRCLRDESPPSVELDAYDHQALDITDEARVADCIKRSKPAWVINGAAYTAVDRAESERELAFGINASGARHLAVACKQFGARLVHVSTDFVFDGSKIGAYSVTDEPRPVSAYGESKLAGERSVLESLPSALVVRTSWLYSEYGNNFVKTMLRLMRERDELGVVDDQRGSPTYARGLAQAIWQLLLLPVTAPGGVYHWSDLGVTTWHGFATEIQNQALDIGTLHRQIPIQKLATSQYPTPARRPANSQLDCSRLQTAIGETGTEWPAALHDMLLNLANFDH